MIKMSALILASMFLAVTLLVPASALAKKWDPIGDFKKAGKKVKKAAKAVGKAAKSAADKAKQVTVAGIKMTEAEAKAIGEGAKNVYGDALDTVDQGVEFAREELKKANEKILEPIFRDAGKKAIGEYKGFLQAFHNNVKNLDKAGMDTLHRIGRAVAAGETKGSLRDDLKILAGNLGLLADQANCIIPEKVRQSSWGITIAPNGMYGLVGGEGAVGVVMNTFLDKGKYPVGLTAGGNVAFGVGADAGLGINVFWGPGTVQDAQGMSAGLGFNADVGPGVSVGLSWAIEKDMFKDAANGIPGFSLGMGVGVGVDAALNVGYTHLVKEF